MTAAAVDGGVLGDFEDISSCDMNVDNNLRPSFTSWVKLYINLYKFCTFYVKLKKIRLSEHGWHDIVLADARKIISQGQFKHQSKFFLGNKIEFEKWSFFKISFL